MSTRDDIADRIAAQAWPSRPASIAAAVLALLAAEGMVVLGPDGEPLDVRPALRALGRAANEYARGTSLDVDECRMAHATQIARLPRPLADACLAAAEVEP